MSSRARANANPVSLFPFLAVLICTMGALILLLIIITKLAKSQQVADVQVLNKSREIEEMEYETAMAESMTGDLLESKKQTELEIENERAKMMVLEKQIAKIASEIDQTVTFLEQRKNNQADRTQETEELQKQLELKQSELGTLNEEYKELQQHHVDGKRSYAIIPYRGPNGTFKRPIYIECTYDKVIIQPEGIVFSEMDFVLAAHPDNPLDAGIRAAYHYYLERGLVEHGSEPYPLILVRPHGIDAYYAVRTAINSWNDNFGYELVEEDWKLEFPEANPELKKEITNRVEIARLRLQPIFESLMAAEMRRQGLGRGNLARNGIGAGRSAGFGTGSDAGSGAAQGQRMPGPGTAVNGGSIPGGIPATYSGAYSGTDPGGSPAGHSLFGSVAAGNGDGGSGEGGIGDAYAGSGNGGMMFPQNSGYGLGGGEENAFAGGDFSVTTQQGEYDSRGSYAGMPTGQPSTVCPGTGGVSAGEGSSLNDFFIQTEHDNVSKGESGRITMEQIWGSQQNAVQTNPKSAPQNPAYAENFDSTQRRPFQPFYEPEPPKNIAANSRSWGTPSRSGMTPIGRNIPLICYPDKMVFVRAAGKGVEREIPVSPSLNAVSGEFVDTIWKYIETWGDAGGNMYWRPTLKVTVGPGAESQFEELKTMLSGSGLKVERAQ